MSRTFVLKLTSAIAVEGEVLKAGSLVEVSEIEAKNLLSRGKAELHGEQEGDLPRDLTEYTKDQLKDLAEQLQITVDSKWTKNQLIEAIEHYDADNSAEHVPGVSAPAQTDPTGSGTSENTGEQVK